MLEICRKYGRYRDSNRVDAHTFIIVKAIKALHWNMRVMGIFMKTEKKLQKLNWIFVFRKLFSTENKKRDGLVKDLGNEGCRNVSLHNLRYHFPSGVQNRVVKFLIHYSIIAGTPVLGEMVGYSKAESWSECKFWVQVMNGQWMLNIGVILSKRFSWCCSDSRREIQKTPSKFSANFFLTKIAQRRKRIVTQRKTERSLS